jgi:hypothetical protein
MPRGRPRPPTHATRPPTHVTRPPTHATRLPTHATRLPTHATRPPTHGNLVCGVCVLGMLSQTFAVVALGPHGQQVYLQNARLDAVCAQAVGLVHQLCRGVVATQMYARDVARLAAGSDGHTKVLRCHRVSINVVMLACEAIGAIVHALKSHYLRLRAVICACVHALPSHCLRLRAAFCAFVSLSALARRCPRLRVAV